MTKYVRTFRWAAVTALALGVTAGTLTGSASAADPADALITSAPGAPCALTITLTIGGTARDPLTVEGTVAPDGQRCGHLPAGLTSALTGILSTVMGGNTKARDFFGRGLVPCSTDRTFGSAENNINFVTDCTEAIPS
ncbi:hypothetical protein GCM10027589_30800 [Actinocorallia lasiicapitis]